MTDPALQEAERALKAGRRRMLLAMVGSALAALVALVVYMASGDDEAVARFGRSVNGLDMDHFKAFWGCALPGANLKEIRTNEDLERQIHLRAEERPQAYGRHLREKCLGKLAGMPGKLRALIPPEGFDQPLQGMDRPPAAAMADAVERLGGAVGDFASYLGELEGGYDREMGAEKVQPIARAWYDYRVALAAVNRAIKERQGGS